jgi:hypothetical protein
LGAHAGLRYRNGESSTLAAERVSRSGDRILKAQIKGRLLLSEEKTTLAEIAQTCTILGWYRVANAEDFGVIKLSPQKF